MQQDDGMICLVFLLQTKVLAGQFSIFLICWQYQIFPSVI